MKLIHFKQERFIILHLFCLSRITLNSLSAGRDQKKKLSSCVWFGFIQKCVTLIEIKECICIHRMWNVCTVRITTVLNTKFTSKYAIFLLNVRKLDMHNEWFEEWLYIIRILVIYAIETIVDFQVLLNNCITN